MPAEVENMFYVGEVPWHGLGIHLDNPPDTWQEAVVLAGLDWEVEKRKVYFDSHGNPSEFAGKYATVRTSDEKPLGIIGTKYAPLQNREAFEFMDGIVGTGKVTYDTAGALRGGAIVWALAKLQGQICVVGDDVVDKYLLLSNSHDGSRVVQVALTPIRVVCMNTLNMATFNEGTQQFRVRHTTNVLKGIRDAAEQLGMLNKQFDEVAEVYQFLASKQVPSSAKLEKYVEGIFPGDSKRAQNIRDNVVYLFEHGRGNDLPGVRHSWWAAYNAVTERTDHRGDGKNDSRRDNALRSAWFGAGEAQKQQALTAAMVAAA